MKFDCKPQLVTCCWYVKFKCLHLLTVRKTASTASRRAATMAGFFSLNFSRSTSVHCTNKHINFTAGSKYTTHVLYFITVSKQKPAACK